MPAPAPAIAQEVIWKNDELMRFAVALVEGALARLKMGNTEWTTDIVPESDRGTGKGIPGSVVSMLQAANVIEPMGATVEKVWYALRVKSVRPGAKARYLGVYRLKGQHLAEAFLARQQAATGEAPASPAGEAPAGAREARALPEAREARALPNPLPAAPPAPLPAQDLL